MAVLLFGAALVGISAPGFAQQLDSAPLATLNALTLPQVPPAPEPVQAEPVPANATQLQPAVVQDAPVTMAQADAIDDDDDYDSLAEAVAAQSAAADDSELRCLASGVYFESKGEPLAGQLAVAQTILNRTRSGRFPKSVCSVLTQRGQFSFVRGGNVPSGSGRAWSTAIAVAKVAQRDLWDSAAGNALFFHARSVAPGWRMAKVAAIGNHVFYR
ncbi:cell wall hydrolase [Sphingomonas sp.]|uniref:cell wall hydrolase n=1 Tax=Sphingomonas sp. TaxID=28214 RepID=UPI002B79D571|nr:cell wall hydrolase [Sphingomonas sp.]HWK35995.1 cell wall hydrolase [Sphingomonas sp.]